MCCFHRSEPSGATVRAHRHILGSTRWEPGSACRWPTGESLGQCPRVSAHAWEVCTQRVLRLSLCLLLRVFWKSAVTGSGKEGVCCFVVFSHLCWYVLSPLCLPPPSANVRASTDAPSGSPWISQLVTKPLAQIAAGCLALLAPLYFNCPALVLAPQAFCQAASGITLSVLLPTHPP